MEHQTAPTFSTGNIRKVEYGRIRYVFDLRIGPVVLRECAVIVGEDQMPKFAAARRIKEKFSNAWLSVADVDSRFMRLVFSDVMAKIETPKPTEPDSRDAWAEEQEASLERAIDEFGAGS